MALAPAGRAGRGHPASTAAPTTTTCGPTSCFKSVFHTAPSAAMKADALAAVSGRGSAGGAGSWSTARQRPTTRPSPTRYKRVRQEVRRQDRREQVYKYTGGARRTDTGHVQIQAQMPVFTQDAPDYDVAGRGRRERRLRRVPALPHLGPAPGRRHASAWCPTAWSRVARAVGRHAAAAPLREARRPLDDRARLQRLGGGARGRRGRDPHADRRSRGAARLHAERQVRARRPSRARG